MSIDDLFIEHAPLSIDHEHPTVDKIDKNDKAYIAHKGLNKAPNDK